MNDINKTISFSKHPTGQLFGWKKKGCVGIISPSYGTEKVSYGCSPSGYTFNKIHRAPLHRLEKKGTFLNYTPVALDYPVELVHTFNALPVGIRPFIASFENEMPRYLGHPEPWKIDFGLELMSSARCKALLSLSDIAALQLKAQLKQRGCEDAAKKVSVFRGTIGESIHSSTLRQLSNKNQSLRVLFVGRDAFGKGLIPTLSALNKCAQLGLDIKATIVCNFEEREYISKFKKPDKNILLSQIEGSKNLRHHYLLPSNEIKKLMQSHDVLLFPTLDESLGWVAVEAGLAGMATISTDIFAIPEIVINRTTGFLIDINKNNYNKRWSGLWMDGDEFSENVHNTFSHLEDGIVEALLTLHEDRSLLLTMGAAAENHIKSLYSIENASRQLSEIYSNALHPI